MISCSTSFNNCLLLARPIGGKTKNELFKTLVRPVLLYGCEAWKQTAAEEKELDRFQFTCLRRILKIWWPQHIRNDTISQVMGVNKISDEIRRRRRIWIGTCSERRGMMTAWWRWSGNLKGREEWDDLKPHGEGRWKKNPGKTDGPAGPKSGAQRKSGLVNERKLQPYVPHGAERTNWKTSWLTFYLFYNTVTLTHKSV